MSQDENNTTENELTDDVSEVESAEDVVREELPDDHPLVKTLAKQRAELKELKKSFTLASKELDEYRQSQLTEQERLISKTKEETRQEVKVELSGKLVEAELKSALKNRHLIGDAILDFNINSFIDDTGDVDSEAIATWVEAHSTQAEAPKPNLGQGVRGTTGSLAQIRSRDELTNMTPDEILKARKDGRLDSLMGKH
jgi:DNA repair exonuclease SbcCD ATPase subunit